MSFKIEKILDGLELGEGPHWDAQTQTLYFVDSNKGTIHSYVPSTKQHAKAALGGKVSIIIPIEGEVNKFVVSIDRKLAKVTWDGISDKVSEIEILGEVENAPETKGNRFNDGKVDPAGRLWIGTLGHENESLKFLTEKANLYSYEKGKGFKHQLNKISISNGLAWNQELKKFYYVDTLSYKVDEFDYDEINGAISNRQTIFTPQKHNIPSALPDGQAIDTDGNLWVALFNGGRVVKIDPRRPETLLDTIHFPANQITSVAFGGPNLDELYVTSANIPNSELYSTGNEGGVLYKVTAINAKGYPGKKF